MTSARPAAARRLITLAVIAALALAVPVAQAPAAHALSPSATILDLTNDYRASKGLPPLRWNQDVAKVAQAWSDTMLRERRMYHNPSIWSQMPGGWSAAAENVGYACGYSSPTSAAKAIMQAWITSSGHEANLRGGYTDLGVGFAWDPGSRCAYTTQDFGRYGAASTASVFGTVVNPSGGASAGTAVIARSGSGTFSTTTDGTGSYQLTGLPLGRYTLEFRPSTSGQRAEFHTDATATACAARVDIRRDIIGLDARLSSSSAPQVSGQVLLCDVSADPSSRYYSQFARDIQWLADTGVTTGWPNAYGAANFRPQSPVTREAMAAFMYRLAGSPAVTVSTTGFADVAGTAFETEIAWLAGQEVTQGWDRGDGTAEYRPLASINRDAMAAFLFRFAGAPDTYVAPAVSPFRDVSPTTPFYREICWLAEQGITTGWDVAGGKEFRPADPITRDAMAAFLQRFEAAT